MLNSRRTNDDWVADSSQTIVAALRSPDPLAYLLRCCNIDSEAKAKTVLFAHSQLLPCDDSEPIPPALCSWLTLVQSHLQSLPLLTLLELSTLILADTTRMAQSAHKQGQSIITYDCPCLLSCCLTGQC